MHQELRDWLSEIRQTHSNRFIGQRVLEVGSLNINGTVRDYFSDCSEYVGVDLVEGPGVDLVCFAHELKHNPGSFDVVVSCECLEHDKYWRQTVEKMIELCRAGGFIIISCATENRPEHGTATVHPNESGTTQYPDLKDYYKNIDQSELVELFRKRGEDICIKTRDGLDLYCYCNKR